MDTLTGQVAAVFATLAAVLLTPVLLLFILGMSIGIDPLEVVQLITSGS